MPKECGLGVITNFKEKFPIGLEMEVLVIKEQNADGMVTVSARVDSQTKLGKSFNFSNHGELIEVLINGFNRGGLTCDVDGLRGLSPDHNLKMDKIINLLLAKSKVAFLEVNPETRKLVLSERKHHYYLKFPTSH